MKGLLLKDWYQVRASMKGMFAAIAVMLAAWCVDFSGEMGFILNYAGFLIGMVPMTLISYEISCGWLGYSFSLPLSRKLQVGEKYLMGLMALGVAEGMTMLVYGISYVLYGVRNGLDGAAGGTLRFPYVAANSSWHDGMVLWLVMAEAAIVILVMNSIFIPLVYRFGTEKSRILYILLFAGYGIILGATGKMLPRSSDGMVSLAQLQNSAAITPAKVMLVLLPIALALYAMSWRVSVAWYGKYKK